MASSLDGSPAVSYGLSGALVQPDLETPMSEDTPRFSPDTEVATLEAWDQAHVWHPFTQAEEWEADGPPLIIDRAEGCELIDVQGRRYLDGVSSLWTNVHGHRHPGIDQALRTQIDKIAHSTLLGLGGTPSIQLARRVVQLCERIPGDTEPLTRVFYSDSGSTAVEVALKMAFQYQQQIGAKERTRFAALSEAYHGDTIGSVSVGGIDLFHEIYRPLLFDAVRIPCPDQPDPSDEARCLKEARSLFETHGSEIAALVVEPLVQGAAGMRMHSPDFLGELLQLARSAGALLIVDEVATGMGRTGTLFAMEQVGIRPDLLCLAKGISGGYLPLALTLASETVYDAFRGSYTDYRTLFHGHTYTGNALACAAALASIQALEDEQTLEGLPVRQAALEQAMAALPSEHVAQIRQKGMMAGVLLRHTRPPEDRVGHRICMAARSHGVILRPLGDVIVLMPPLTMSVEQIARIGQALGLAMQQVLD
jgi:adenosylmethionine-8-amino-7-oxononanoate aminotransferase